MTYVFNNELAKAYELISGECFTNGLFLMIYERDCVSFTSRPLYLEEQSPVRESIRG